VKTSLLIIGAGPSGLLAAWAAAQHAPPESILVVDHMPAAGIKLSKTGGGRGNISHLASEEEFATAFGRQGRFTLPAFRSLPPKDLQTLLGEIGIPTRVDETNRIYPHSQSAVQVRDALYDACLEEGVRFAFNHRAESLLPPETPDAPWIVDSFSAHSVLLATGGQSAPQLGSDGSGFSLAQSLGYTITPPAPALSPLLLKESWLGTHSGLSLSDVTLTLAGERGGKIHARGEILFTHRGISGPVVLNLSGQVARLLSTGSKARLQLKIHHNTPDLPRLRQMAGPQSVHAWLTQSIPRSLASTLLELAGIPPQQSFSRLTTLQEKSLTQILCALPLTIQRTGGFEESMVTTGGITLKQVNPNTLEGRLTPRLYFAGEILDLDGPTGGWNIQWAFCSGYLAGAASVKESR